MQSGILLWQSKGTKTPIYVPLACLCIIESEELFDSIFLLDRNLSHNWMISLIRIHNICERRLEVLKDVFDSIRISLCQFCNTTWLEANITVVSPSIKKILTEWWGGRRDKMVFPTPAVTQICIYNSSPLAWRPMEGAPGGEGRDSHALLLESLIRVFEHLIPLSFKIFSLAFPLHLFPKVLSP